MATIMVVDDSQFMRKRISRSLASNGFDVCEAADGQEAVDTYRQTKPDVTLMDIIMPNKDGLEALAEIRQFDARARVIMLTALDQQAVMAEAMRLGAKDFLTKPVVPDRLIATIQRLLG